MTIYLSGNVGADGDPYIRALQTKTVYHAASAYTPRNRLTRGAKGHLDLLTNSGSLMATTVVNSALGFLYWWVAARAFPASIVGEASAATSALTLIGTLSMFGMGTLLISELPRMKSEAQWRMIATCVGVAGSVALVGGAIYVLLAEFVITGLRSSIQTPYATGLLILGIVTTAMTLVLDDGLIGLLSGPLQLARNGYFAVLKLVALVVIALLPLTVDSSGIFATWVLGGIASVGLLWINLKRRGIKVSLRPQVSLLRGLVRSAFDHNLLNLALYLPRITLPLVVTAMLSPAAAGAYYAAYMMVSFLVMIPANLATTLFAVAKGDRAGLRSKIRVALLISAGAGIPGALLLAALAHLVMEVFGHSYAMTAGTALAIMALTYPAMIFRPLYIAVSRVLGRVRHASVFAVVAGAAEIGAACYGGSRGSLTSLALCLSAVFVVEGIFVAPTVLRIAFGGVRAPKHVAGPKSAIRPELESKPVPQVPVRRQIDLSDVTMYLPRQSDAPPVSADETMYLPRQTGSEPIDATTVLPRQFDTRPVSADETMVLPRQRDDRPAETTNVLPPLRESNDLADATMVLPRQTDPPAGPAAAAAPAGMPDLDLSGSADRLNLSHGRAP